MGRGEVLPAAGRKAAVKMYERIDERDSNRGFLEASLGRWGPLLLSMSFFGKGREWTGLCQPEKALGSGFEGPEYAEVRMSLEASGLFIVNVLSPLHETD